MICRADQHYKVERGGPEGHVQRLRCMQCDFSVSRSEVSGAAAPGWSGRTTSGAPRYNRMRARMVKHIHASHPAEIPAS